MICDTHNDFPTKLSGKSFFDYIKYCEKSGVKVILASVFTTEQHNPWYVISHTIHHIQYYASHNNIKILLHVEDLGYLKDINDLNKLIDLKPFSCGLVWNYDNTIATQKGLTEFGRIVVQKLKEHNILIDLAHANKKTFYQAVKIIKKHIFVSHTGFYALCRHKRNINNRQARRIIKSGGFIGLFLVRSFMKGGLNAHISHAARLGGKDNIGIGTDYLGTRDLLPGYKKYAELSERVPHQILYQNFINFLSRIGKL